MKMKSKVQQKFLLLLYLWVTLPGIVVSSSSRKNPTSLHNMKAFVINVLMRKIIIIRKFTTSTNEKYGAELSIFI